MDSFAVSVYEFRNGLLLYRGKAYVPDANDLHTALVRHFHNSREGGHSGVYCTWQPLS